MKGLFRRFRKAPAAPAAPAFGPPPRCLRAARAIAWLLDDGLRIPVINRRIGLDPVLGLLPFWGDWVSFALSLYLLGAGAYLKAPPRLLGRMAIHIALDQAVSVVPVVGDLLDFGVKANRANLTLLEQWAQAPETISAQPIPLWTPLRHGRLRPFMLRWPRLRRRKAGG